MAAFLRAVNDVVKFSLTFSRNFQTHSERLAGGSASIGFFFRQIAIRIAALVRDCAGAFGDVFFDGRVFALFLRREVAIRRAFFEQTVRGGAMLRGVCGLENEIFVVVESEPLETFDDGAG